MNGILLIERAILEALEKKTMTEIELINEIGVEKKFILNSIRSLIIDKLIQFDGHGYSLKEIVESEMKTDLSNSENEQSEEKLDMVQFFDQLKIEKLYMDSFEEKLLQIHLKNFYDFIHGIKLAEKKGFKKTSEYKTCDRKVIFVGSGRYGDILTKSLELSC